MKKSALIINGLFLLAILILDICYIIFDGIVLKSITSLCFFTLGVINLLFAIKMKSNKLKFSILLLAGLFFAMMGDIILEIHFISGAVLFAIGHIFFFISFCFIQRFKWIDLAYGLIIFVPSCLVITLLPCFDFGGVLMEVVAVAYALIISLMVGKAISNLIRNYTSANLIILIGSILFFFSDLMLLFNVFADISSAFGVLCLITYYPAEFLLAFSILYSTLRSIKYEDSKE